MKSVTAPTFGSGIIKILKIVLRASAPSGNSVSLSRRFYFSTLLAFVILFPAKELFSQQVIVNIQHPPFNQLRIEDLWKLTLVNTSSGTFTVHLKGTLTETQAGLIATGISKTFDLSPGTKIFTAANYSELDPDIDYVNRDPRYEESVIRSGGLPSGEYEICIYVIDNSSGDELGFQCIEQQVMLAAPPSLISPEDGSEVTVRNPTFVWTPVVGIPRVQYKFKVVEILGRQSIFEAIEKNNPLFSTTLNQTTLTYPPQALPFEEGKRYAWRVQSVDVNGNPVGSNNGLSDAWSFIFKTGAVEIFEITRPQAIDIIIKKVIVPPTLDHDATAYLGMEPIDSGVVISSYNKDEMERTNERRVWFGWINDEPQAFFEHPTRYVFIDARTGDYTIEIYNWWPVVNGESLWMSDEELENPDVLIYSTVHLK